LNGASQQRLAAWGQISARDARRRQRPGHELVRNLSLIRWASAVSAERRGAIDRGSDEGVVGLSERPLLGAKRTFHSIRLAKLVLGRADFHHGLRRLLS